VNECMYSRNRCAHTILLVCTSHALVEIEHRSALNHSTLFGEIMVLVDSEFVVTLSRNCSHNQKTKNIPDIVKLKRGETMTQM
jgi:hypothetical protein